MGQQGLHIITPNKKLGAGPLQRYQQLRQLQRDTGKHFMYEVRMLLLLLLLQVTQQHQHTAGTS
jgi:hypothetical protein